MRYNNFLIKTALGEILKYDKQPIVARGSLTIEGFKLQLSEVKDVKILHKQRMIVIDLVDGPPTKQADKASALSKMSMLTW